MQNDLKLFMKLMAVSFALFMVVVLCSCKKEVVNQARHQCKWKLCPYKGITSDQFVKSVASYVGNSESDAFSIDMLHLYSPAAEYEELETMLRED